MKECYLVERVARSLLRKQIFLPTMKHHAKSSSNGEPPAKKRHWREGLLETMEDPESIVMEDDKIVVIKDKYPKAHYHFLVLPKENIHSIKEVEKKHENLLEHMERIGQEVADKQEGHEFILGYHVVPSMHRLHLHVISTDFDSPCLKNKYHWNSFTTAYFRPSKKYHLSTASDAIPKVTDDTLFPVQISRLSPGSYAVPEVTRNTSLLTVKQNLQAGSDVFQVASAAREELKEYGRIKQMNSKDTDKLLKTDLQCHKCPLKPKNIPELKRHLLTHLPKK